MSLFLRRGGRVDVGTAAPSPGGTAQDRPHVAGGAHTRAGATGSPAQLTSPDEAVSAVVTTLSGYLRAVAGLPAPTVVVLQVSDRTLGLGNSRGLEPIGTFDAVELYGGWVDCVVRFQVWGIDAAAADAAMTALQGRLLGARAELFGAGLLEFDGVAGTLPLNERNAWSRTADYHALFEYHLVPVSNADSLIAAIPVDAETDVPTGERTTVTDDAVRWDQTKAPALVVRGRRTLTDLAVAAFLPAPQPSGEVHLVRSNDAATTPPADYATLGAFLAALNDPVAPERNGRFVFPTLAGFVAAFDNAGELLLGDWDADGNPDGYLVGGLTLDPPVPLTAATDRFEILLQTSPLDHIGVVYLRAARALG